jgi:hypothetical protein
VVPGDLALGRFRIRDRIGSGGMGTVYRALDERLGREVALKEIPGAITSRASREAKAAARLNHPCVATLYELATDGRRTILVSELARGRPLGDLAAAGMLTDRDVGEIALDVAAALAHAHARGVVHRDVKPANIVVELEAGGARAKLVDFGIAALAGERRLTASGEVVGTLAYMAPEQAEGGDAGPQADLYSLALTLYECWSGSNPVAAATPAATARRIGSPLTPLGEARRDLPQDLADAIEACLAPGPGARPPTAELVATLERELGALDAGALLPPTAADATATFAGPGRRGRMLAALALAGILWAVAAAAGRPGLALVLAALGLPALLVASSLEAVVTLLTAPLLLAASLGGAFPALAGRLRAPFERAIVGALGWCWIASTALATSSGTRVGISEPASAGWTASVRGAATGILAPLASPRSLAAAALFAVGALAFGWIARAHLALATFGALFWAAALTGALRVIGEPGPIANPLVAVAAAIVALALARHPRSRRRRRLEPRSVPAGASTR